MKTIEKLSDTISCCHAMSNLSRKRTKKKRKGNFRFSIFEFWRSLIYSSIWTNEERDDDDDDFSLALIRRTINWLWSRPEAIVQLITRDKKEKKRNLPCLLSPLKSIKIALVTTIDKVVFLPRFFQWEKENNVNKHDRSSFSLRNWTFEKIKKTDLKAQRWSTWFYRLTTCQRFFLFFFFFLTNFHHRDVIMFHWNDEKKQKNLVKVQLWFLPNVWTSFVRDSIMSPSVSRQNRYLVKCASSLDLLNRKCNNQCLNVSIRFLHHHWVRWSKFGDENKKKKRFIDFVSTNEWWRLFFFFTSFKSVANCIARRPVRSSK